MPWKETCAVKERAQFVRDLASGQWTMTELCEHHGVSRPTGYKWARRYQELGEDGLNEHSRAPKSCPHRTATEIEEQVVLLKKAHGWGARKLHRLLRKQLEASEVPCRSTVFDILKRHGLVKHRRRRQRWQHPGAAPLHTDAPNEVWTIDFKGQFKTRDGIYCYPLTVLDNYSRFLLACTGLHDVKTRGTKRTLERLFREVGLPEAIRSDNGAPFASTGIHGLCELNVWWMKLGIVHQRIQPSSPQENGAHERMHRTLKAATTRPPAQSLRGQQWKFDSFRAEYNDDRPHETLDDEAPASLWGPSPRPFPTRLARPEYPSHFELRRVSNAGHFRLGALQIFISHALRGDQVGLEEIDDGLWNILYYKTLLGRLDQRTGKITGATFRSEEC
jgi:transposase InsO family protein